MDYREVSVAIEGKLHDLFQDLRKDISAREDSRAFGAMIEKRITDNWSDICSSLAYKAVSNPGRRTIYDFACEIDGVLVGFDVKTKDLDATRYSDGGVCAVGNLLKYMANDAGVFMIVEFGHKDSDSKGTGRDIHYIRIAPFHTLPKDIYRIENLGTGQVRLDNTLDQAWNNIEWTRSYHDFFEIFCDLTIQHYERVKSVADTRALSIKKFKDNGFKNFSLR